LRKAAPAEAACVRQPVRAQHDVTDVIASLVGRDHLARAFTGHHLAQANRLRVRLAVVHAAAHVRIERQVEHAQQ
jgi:hypothetical protein